MALAPTALESKLAEKFLSFKEKWTGTASFREKELMLIWIVNEFNTVESKEEKSLLLQSLSDGLKLNAISPTQPLSYSAISFLVKFIVNNLQNGMMNIELTPCIDNMLTIPCVKNYLKQNEKICGDLFSTVAANLRFDDPQDTSIMNSLLTLYHSMSNNEKAVTSFLKKAVNSLAVLCAHILAGELTEGYKSRREGLIQLLQVMFFGKNYALKLKTFLHSCFEKTEAKTPRHLALFKSLFSVSQAQLPIESKVGFFRFIVEALATSDQIEDLEVMRFIILLGHLLGIEQKVGGTAVLLDAEHIKATLGVISTSCAYNFTIWNAVIQTLGKRSLNLTIELPKLSGLQWFRSFGHFVLKEENFTSVHIQTLTELFLLDSSILEPSLSKIFIKIFSNESFSTVEHFQEAYESFLTTSITIFSRLQRINKLILKFLPAIASVSAAAPSQKLLPASFLESLSAITTVLPSAHSLNLIQILLDQLDSCTISLEEDTLNSTLVQSVGFLLSTVISGCRLLCYSLPRPTIETFIALMGRLKNLLSRFGTLILLRTHDREIMQSFLRICHVWGETSALVALYASDDGPPCLPADSAPSDLSPTLSFITGDQWSVLTERISNFGNYECNKLLMKLLVQKLRIASLSGEKSLVNMEATAKYIVERQSNVYGVGITTVVTCEEMSIIVNVLPEDKAKALVDILFSELIETDQNTIDKWFTDPALLENPKFVEALFEVAFRNLVEGVEEKDVWEPLHDLFHSLQQVSSSCLSLSGRDETIRIRLDAAFTTGASKFPKPVIGKLGQMSLRALTTLPFGHIASMGGAGLIAITGAMVALNLGDTLIPIFQRLLSLSKTLDDFFDIGLCIQWLVANIADRTFRAPIIELLVLKSTQSKSGLKQFKGLINSLKRGNNCLTTLGRLETQVHLHNSVRKCWRQGGDPQAVELNDVIAKQRRRLNKGLHSALQDASAEISKGHFDSGWVLLDAYAIELLRLDREGNVDGVVALNFKSYLKKAIKGAKSKDDIARQSSLNFLTTVLKCVNALRKATANDELVFNIWRQLKGENLPVLWPHVCTAASEKEFKKIMMDLLASIQAGLVPPANELITWETNLVPPNSLRPLIIKLADSKTCGQWSNHYIDVSKLFLLKSKGVKQQCCYDMIRRLISQTQNLLPRKDNSFSESLLGWLRFLHFIATHPSVPMRPNFEDYLLDVILAAPEDVTPFCEHFTVRMDLLSALLHPQKIPNLRKVPLIFQTFLKLLRWLLRESDASISLPPEDIASRALAAFHLEKWIGLIVRRKEFRVMPLFVTEIVHSLANITVYPPVKMHLKNAVFSMLGITEEQTIKFLLRTLPPGCQQVFTNLHQEFHKFHRYKGKI